MAAPYLGIGWPLALGFISENAANNRMLQSAGNGPLRQVGTWAMDIKSETVFVHRDFDDGTRVLGALEGWLWCDGKRIYDESCGRIWRNGDRYVLDQRSHGGHSVPQWILDAVVAEFDPPEGTPAAAEADLEGPVSKTYPEQVETNTHSEQSAAQVPKKRVYAREEGDAFVHRHD